MTLARFTPSILDGEVLEQLFVQRHHLLDDVMLAVRDAASGDERRHKLFIGPRGAGKTHLISLVNHRVRRARDDGLRVGLSWLTEDPWDIETYDDLLDQILDNLDDPGLRPRGEAGVRQAVETGGPIVVLVENLDQILTAVGADGQRRLRALLENGRPLLLIATSTRLSDDLLSQAEPFYGFFDQTQLEPFSVEQAADMLWHVARYADDQPLTALLESPHATARLATIAHLAGGQPRVWALLGTGLTDGGIDDMVDMLLARFDDLTPYYQEQLARLSPSERKAVRRLADADRPLTVRDLASLAKTDQRSMSKTVSDLRKRGWVRKHESILTAKLDARLSYYELAEPLARIAFQMKAARGEPVRLIVDFLSLWFEQDQLRDERDNVPGAPYRQAADANAGQLQQLIKALTDDNAQFSMVAPDATMLMTVASGLAQMAESGDVSTLMALPAPLMHLIANRLSDMTVTELRLLVSELAVGSHVSGDWRSIVEPLASCTSGVQLARVLAALVSLAESSASQEALLKQFDGVVTSLSHDQADEALSKLLWATIGSELATPELFLSFAHRRAANRPELAVVRSRFLFAAAYAYALDGDFDDAEALMRREHEQTSVLPWDNELRLDVTHSLAAVLVQVGKSAEGLALLDAAPDSEQWREATRYTRERAASEADETP